MKYTIMVIRVRVVSLYEELAGPLILTTTFSDKRMRVECINIIVHIYVLVILPQCTMMGLISETLIECASDEDFTFKLHNSILNVSNTIAECHVVDKKCSILMKTHKYNVTYTGHSSLLKIRVLDNSTIGTYHCFETLNSKNIVSTIIAPSDNMLAAESCYEKSQEAYGAGKTDTSGHIVLGTLKNASIECSSNVELTFSFFSHTSQTHATLGECDFAKKSCKVFPSLPNKYRLVYTGCGGFLQIESLDNDTIGEYYCYETFNPQNNISFIISFPFTDSKVYTTYNVTVSTESNGVLENDLKISGAKSQTIEIVAYVLVPFSVFMCCIVICLWKKSKLCFASKTTKASAEV